MLIQEHVVLGEIMFTHWTTLTITLSVYIFGTSWNCRNKSNFNK